MYEFDNPKSYLLRVFVSICMSCLDNRPGSFAAAVVSPCGERLEGEDARNVDVDHPRPWETALEHRVEANHMEEVESVVLRHLANVSQILRKF